MATARKLAAGLIMLLLLALPAAACMAEGEAMSQTEQECCREMAGDCGKVPMKASHSCCATVVDRDQPAKLDSQFSLALPPAVLAPAAPSLSFPAAPAFVPFVEAAAESPPPAFSPILRI